MDITGNTVLITGGGSGIGLSLAKGLLELDNTIIVCGRNIKKLEEVKKEHSAIHTAQCDITRSDDTAHLFDEITNDYPNLNVLINNAGIQYNYDFSDGNDHIKLIDNEINANFSSHVRLTDLFLPHLIRQPKAAIVNVSSALAIVPKESAPIYCATKAAIHNFTKALQPTANSVVKFGRSCFSKNIVASRCSVLCIVNGG